MNKLLPWVGVIIIGITTIFGLGQFHKGVTQTNDKVWALEDKVDEEVKEIKKDAEEIEDEIDKEKAERKEKDWEQTMAMKDFQHVQKILIDTVGKLNQKLDKELKK